MHAPRTPFASLIVLLLGLLLTYFVRDAIRQHDWQTARDEFDFRVNEIVGNIDRRLHAYEQLLSGTVGLFAASHEVGRSEFAEYVRAQQIAEKYLGIQGVGFSLLIPAQDKARHIAAIRAEGFPAYTLRSEGTREIYSSII